VSTTPSESSGGSPPQRRSKAQKGTPDIRIKVSWCKGCGLCVDYCKSDVLVMDGVVPRVVDAQRCTWCLQCEAICPDFAIEVLEAEAGNGVPATEAADAHAEAPPRNDPEQARSGREAAGGQDRPSCGSVKPDRRRE
jgi:2-oxoglutarate ferredoxin oxidoreductase subunit delta